MITRPRSTNFGVDPRGDALDGDASTRTYGPGDLSRALGEQPTSIDARLWASPRGPRTSEADPDPQATRELRRRVIPPTTHGDLTTRVARGPAPRRQHPSQWLPMFAVGVVCAIAGAAIARYGAASAMQSPPAPATVESSMQGDGATRLQAPLESANGPQAHDAGVAAVQQPVGATITPGDASRALASGDLQTASALYAALAAQRPHRPVYAHLARVLAHCVDDSSDRGRCAL